MNTKENLHKRLLLYVNIGLSNKERSEKIPKFLNSIFLSQDDLYLKINQPEQSIVGIIETVLHLQKYEFFTKLT